MPTTIVLFALSPVSNRPEDLDLFIADCAEKLNAGKVPLQLITILVVQCNTDSVLYRQLLETRRAISWRWYTPKPEVSATVSPAGSGRSTKSSMLNPRISEPKRRPQRDWVDIITGTDWERVGGLPVLTGMIETEIRQGTQRRKELQKEAAKNYLSNLGDEDSIQTLTDKRREGSHINDDNHSRCGFPGGGGTFLEKDGLSSSIANKGCRRADNNQ
jgi:hypothetical protein